MSDRLTRKDIKKEDQFVSTMGATFDYGRSHLKSILLVVGGVVGVSLLGAAIVFYLDYRQSRSTGALAEAMEVRSAPLADSVTDGASEGPGFATEEERAARAKELFAEVSEKYGGTEAGAVAAVFLAGMAADGGNLEEAEALWKKVAKDQKKTVLGMGVQLNLIALKRSRGEGEAVVADLQAALDNEDWALPQDAVLYELAVTLEELERAGEAQPHFQRIIDEFPTSQYAQLAQQKITSTATAANLLNP